MNNLLSKLKATYRVVCFFFSLILPTFCYSQYHFTELGAKIGLGAAVPLANARSNLSTGVQYNLQAFYTHYVCGKAYGYQFEAGFRRYSISEQSRIAPSIYSKTEFGRFTHSFNQFDIAVLGKLRPQNYHRPKEFCFVIGPKLSIGLWHETQKNGKNLNLRSDNHKAISNLLIGLHASVWLRYPIGKSSSLFIAPGVDIYPASQIKTRSEPTLGFTPLFAYLQFGITFWNNR